MKQTINRGELQLLDLHGVNADQLHQQQQTLTEIYFQILDVEFWDRQALDLIRNYVQRGGNGTHDLDTLLRELGVAVEAHVS